MSRSISQRRLCACVATLAIVLPGAYPALAQGDPAEAAAAAVVLDPLSVEGSYTAAPSYQVRDLYSGTKTVTPRLSLPQQVDVVPQEVLRDTAATRVERALDYVPGVGKQNDFGAQNLALYSVRGFATQDIFFNGFNIARGYNGAPDTQNVQSIEVLKGPSGALYGRSDPGGTINILTKQPVALPFVEMGTLFGSFGTARTTVDAGGPLNEEGTVLYRFNGALARQDSFRDFVDGDRVLVAPVVSWQISPDTKLTVEAQYLRNRQTFDRGTVAVNNRLGLVPRSRFFGEPGDDSVSEAGILQIRLDHAFNADWQLRVAGHFNTGSLTGLQTGATGLLDDGRTLLREFRRHDFTWGVAIGQAELVGHFDTGPFAHTVLLGLEHERYNSTENLLRSTPRIDPFAIDLFNPVYGQPKPPFTRRYSASENVGNTAVYAQDQIALSPEWKLLLGNRTDFYNQTFRDKVGDERTEQDRTGFSPRAGLVYQPLSFLSFYGNVAASFRPNTGFDIATRPFAPETGFGYEAGVKLDLFTGLSVTGAAFHIEKENVLTTDPRDFFFQIAAGAVRSQGFDLSFVGQVTPEFRVIGGYAFIDAAVTRDEVLRVGSPLLNIPRHSGSLLGVYEVQAGDWKGFGFGGGVRAVGSRLGDSGNERFRLPGYVLTDALAYYRYENLRFGLNVDNIFDETYYERSYNAFWVGVGEPRRVTVSMTARF